MSSSSFSDNSKDVHVDCCYIPSKVLEEIDVFIWDFDLSLTRLHTISRNDRVISRQSSQSRGPLMGENISNPLSEWYAGRWLLNPEYFVKVVKTLVDVYGKKVGIATHHSYRYFKDDNYRQISREELKNSGEKRKRDQDGSLEQSADSSGLLAGADLVLEYLRIAFQTSGEDVNRYFHQGNVIALDCIEYPGKVKHMYHVLKSLGYVDKDSELISDSLLTSIKADGNRYLRVAMFDDDPNNVFSINREIEKYVDLSDVSSDSNKSVNGSYDYSSRSSGSGSGEVKIRGVVLPTARGGIYCDEALWLRGFVAFPERVLEYGRAGFTPDRLVQLKAMLELEEMESSSSGEFVDDGYDSEEDL